MTGSFKNRRGIVLAAGTALLATPMLASCGGGKDEEKETGAVEDLMREHGVLRRAILVLRESASRLAYHDCRSGPHLTCVNNWQNANRRDYFE
jgi:hypothetical protein